jgi:ubiquinone biosynthesis UbiH/UbiF/VisC/COQ6 family hydroxylase
MNGDANLLNIDIAIVGAGLVGLSAAVALDQAGFSVLLIDSHAPPAPASTEWDSRIYAISPQNAQWLMRLGVWQGLNEQRIGDMQSMEIWGDTTTQPLLMSAAEVNADQLGFIVEAGALTQALQHKVAASGIRTIFNSCCQSLTATADEAMLTITPRLGAESAQTLAAPLITSKLLLAADGSQSWVRQQLGLALQKKSYAQTAVVANFSIEKAHGNIARQWFAPDATGVMSILAYLPLPDNTISIVWSVSTEYAATLMALSAADFTQAVTIAGHGVLGELQLLTPAAAFPLALQQVAAITQNSVVLVGDAAHQIHPMAGQGVNLGFRDVIDLVEVLTKKNPYQAVNDLSLRKQYTRLRKADMLQMLLLTDGLYRLFTSPQPLVKTLRNLGLAAARQPPIRKMLLAHAIGL